MEWPILRVLDEEQRRSLLGAAHRRKFARNEVIFHEGDPGDTLHLLSKGHVAVRVTTPLGDTATVRVLKPGDFFGELAVVSPAPRNATTVAIDAVETHVIHRDRFDELRERHPAVEKVLVEALTTEVRRLAVQLLDALYVPVEKRVWRRLTELAAIFDGVGDTDTVLIPLTQEDLAQVVGTTRPTMNRLLREGEDAGIVRIARGRLEILDLDGVVRRGR